MENAEGLNFAYLKEVTGPQTALIMIYFGDGSTEEYRVATSVERHGCFFSDSSSVWSLRDGGMLNVSFAKKKPIFCNGYIMKVLRYFTTGTRFIDYVCWYRIIILLTIMLYIVYICIVLIKK